MSSASGRRGPRFLITGGGTAGHISPALATITALRELEPECELLYVGSHHGQERALAEAAGVAFTSVTSGKLRRYLSWENVIDQGRVPIGVAQSLRVVRSFAPDAVLSTGGYVAVPPSLAAALLHVPLLLHEQTAQIGLANRICARFARRIALSWEDSINELAPALRARAVVIGNPVRPSIFGGEARRALEYFGLDPGLDSPIVYVTGGSLGARVINEAVEAVLPELLRRCRVVHQCGEQKAGEAAYERLTRARLELPEELRARYALTRFVRDELRDVFAAADLVVGRSGAGTVAELCALGKPALYVPLEPTGGDEQNKNARVARERGAARVLSQNECTGARLLEEIDQLLANRAALRAMGEAARTLSRPGAARELARQLIELVPC